MGIETIITYLKQFPKEIAVFVLAMLPIFELRGAIPIAIFQYNLAPISSYIISVIGNILPILFILLFLKDLHSFLSKYHIFRRFFDWLYGRAMERKKIVEKYGYLGLILFVAIPLPMTGAWTGGLVASFLGLNIPKSFLSISIGVIIAGIIVLLVSVGIYTVIPF